MAAVGMSACHILVMGSNRSISATLCCDEESNHMNWLLALNYCELVARLAMQRKSSHGTVGLQVRGRLGLE